VIAAFEFLKHLRFEQLKLLANLADQRCILVQHTGDKSRLLPIHRLLPQHTPLHAVIAHQIVPFVVAMDDLGTI
jgi:hypothetical protein